MTAYWISSVIYSLNSCFICSISAEQKKELTGPKGDKGDTGGIGYVSFDSDENGHLYAIIAEETDEISFRISDDGKLEVIYA